MTEKKSDELTEPVNMDSPEPSNSDLSHYVSIGKGVNIVSSASAIGKALGAVSSHQQVFDSVKAAIAQPLRIEAPLKPFSSNQRIFDSAIATIAQPLAIEKTLASLYSHQRVFDSAMAAIAQPLGIEKTFASLYSHQRVFDSAMAAIAQPLAIEKTFASFYSHKRIFDSAMAAIAQPLAVERALESFHSNQQIFDSAVAAIIQPLAIEKALASFYSHQHAIDSAMASLANFSAMENTLTSFSAASSMLLRDPSALSAIFSSINISEFSLFELDNLEVDLTTAADQFDNAVNLKSLTSIFTNLPPLIQAIFFFILLQVFLPLVNSISANLLTPVVEEYLQGNNLTDREKVKEIKKIPVYLNDISTDRLRFITGNNVRLRSGPSSKAEILDELRLGQIVTILSKDRNWIEVTYTYKNGEIMTGWVFTRYTAKFIR